MSYSFRKFLDRIRKITSSGRRVNLHSNPSNGLEYNKMSVNRDVSRLKYRFDIAHDSQVLRDFGSAANLHNRARKANSWNVLVQYRASKVNGRT